MSDITKVIISVLALKWSSKYNNDLKSKYNVLEGGDSWGEVNEEKGDLCNTFNNIKN